MSELYDINYFIMSRNKKGGECLSKSGEPKTGLISSSSVRNAVSELCAWFWSFKSANITYFVIPWDPIIRSVQIELASALTQGSRLRAHTLQYPITPLEE